MAKGFLARMGLDASAFTRGLDDSVAAARVAGKKIGVEFEKGQDKAMRAMRRSAKFYKKQSQRFGSSWQTAGVALAAGMAVAASSMSAAAERSDIFRAKLDSINTAKQDLMANLGEDLFGIMGPNPDASIRKIDEMRSSVVDYFAAMVSGQKQVDDINAARAAEKQIARSLKAARAMSDFELNLQAQGGDQSAREMLEDRKANKEINSFAEQNGLSRGQKARLRELSEKSRTDGRAKTQAENDQRRERTFGDESARIALSRQRNGAETLEERVAAERAAAQREDELASRKINDNKDLSEDQKIELIERSTEAIRERTQARIEEMEKAERVRKRDASERAKDLLADNRVQELRSKGQDKLADAKRIELDLQREIRDIRRDEDLSDADKQLLIESGQSRAVAELNALKKKNSGGGVIGAGLAGGSTLRRQILGPGGSGGAGGDTPVVNGINSIIEFVRDILEETVKQGETGAGAVAG